MQDGADRWKWLLKPPGEQEVQVRIAIGPGIEVTPEIRDALEQLLSALQDSEVEGYRKCNPKCPSLNDCTDYGCARLYNCTPLVATPLCAVDMQCFIGRRVS
jgi:hypothetical protein